MSGENQNNSSEKLPKKRKNASKPDHGKPKMRKWRRRLLWLTGSILFLVLVLRVALWLSLPWLLQRTIAPYDLNCTYEELNLSLHSGDMELWHLTLESDSSTEKVLYIEYCKADVSVLSLFVGRLIFHRLEIDGMDIDIRRTPDGVFSSPIPQLITLVRQSKSPVKAPKQKIKFADLDFTAPYKLDAIRLQHVQIQYRDESVSPVLETHYDMNLRLSDVGSYLRDARFQLIISSPPILDQLIIDGTGSSSGNELHAELSIIGRGFHPDPLVSSLARYLSQQGIFPVSDDISLECQGLIDIKRIPLPDVSPEEAALTVNPDNPSGQITSEGRNEYLQIQASFDNLQWRTNAQKSLALNHVSLQADLKEQNVIHISQINLNGGLAQLQRAPSGFLGMAGFEIRNKGDKIEEEAPAPDEETIILATESNAEAVVPTPAWDLSVDAIIFQDIQLLYHDMKVSPAAEITLQLREFNIQDIQFTENSAPLKPTQFHAEWVVPNCIDNILLDGTAQLFSQTKTLDAKIEANGIAPQALEAYLKPIGIESLYQDGDFSCSLHSSFAGGGNLPYNISLMIQDMQLTDEQELWNLRKIQVAQAQLNLLIPEIIIGDVEISDQQLNVNRNQDGSIDVLGFRLKPEVVSQDTQGDVESPLLPSGRSASEPAVKRFPKIVVNHVIWHENQVHFSDQAVSPANNIQLADFGFEANDIYLDFEGNNDAIPPGQFRAWLNSPEVAETISLAGIINPISKQVSFNVDVDGLGIHTEMLSSYLRPMGIVPGIKDGIFHLGLQGDLVLGDQEIGLSTLIRDVTLHDAEVELAGIERIHVDALMMKPGDIQGNAITISNPRATISRDQQGTLHVAGIEFVATESTSTKQKIQETTQFTLDHLQIDQGQLIWEDSAVQPMVKTTATLDATLDNLTWEKGTTPGNLEATVQIPDIVNQCVISGTLFASPQQPEAQLTVEASGIQGDLLSVYLPQNTEMVLKDGQFRTELNAKLYPHPEGGNQARVSITNLDYRESSQGEPLLKFDSALISCTRLDPAIPIIAVEEISLAGLRADIQKSPSNELQLLGLRFSSSETPSPNPESSTIPVAATIPETSTSSQSPRDLRNPSQLPLITIQNLDLHLQQIQWLDLTKPDSAAVTLDEFHIRNRNPIEMLGPDPESRLPIQIDIQGRIDPVMDDLTIMTESSLWITEPLIKIDLDGRGINSAGLLAVLPELVDQMEGSNLSDGRVKGKMQLSLKWDRRNALDFNFNQVFQAHLLVQDVKFTNAAEDKVWTGFQELQINAEKIDPVQKVIHLNKIELINPQGYIQKDENGYHLYNLVWKNASPEQDAPAQSGTGSNQLNLPAGDKEFVPSQIPKSLKPEILIDLFNISGINFTYVDDTADPQMIIPLSGFDFELRDFTTRALYEPHPFRFDMNLYAGKITDPRLQHTSEAPKEYELFQEIMASGKISMQPKINGWVKANIDGLELMNFHGKAKQSGFELYEGVFDGKMDLRFDQDGTIAADAKLSFTDLALAEPPDGPISRYLHLPAPLDTVIFILEDQSSAIQIPLNFKVRENKISGGEIFGVAVTAMASVIANAVISSPYRVAGAIGSLVTEEELDTEEKMTVEIEYGPGEITISGAQLAKIESLIRHLADDKELTATLRHNMGGGDIRQAQLWANPSRQDSLLLVERLRQKRNEIIISRQAISTEARAAYATGDYSVSRDLTLRLRTLNRELGLNERALDTILELSRPRSEHLAQRRTREACISMGRARLESLHKILTGNEIDNALERIKLIRPHFEEVEGTQGGTVIITVNSKTIR